MKHTLATMQNELLCRLKTAENTRPPKTATV
jgi:hypothetical protein